MAQVNPIATYTQENVAPAFYKKVAEAPILSLPGLDVRTGVGKETIDLITPTISLTTGRKTAATAKTSAELFSQNNLDPAIYEEFYSLPINAIRKTFAGNYGADETGAFLENPAWLTDYSNNYMAQLDLEVEKLVAEALKSKLSATDTTINRFTGLTLAAPTTAAIAQANITEVHQFIQDSSRAFRTGGGNKYMMINDGDLNTILLSYAVANNRYIEPQEIDNALVYNIPFSAVKLISVNGVDAGEATIFDTPNMVIKLASDIKVGYFDRDDDLWSRARVWVDANFGFYEEVTTQIAQA